MTRDSQFLVFATILQTTVAAFISWQCRRSRERRPFYGSMCELRPGAAALPASRRRTPVRLRGDRRGTIPCTRSIPHARVDSRELHSLYMLNGIHLLSIQTRGNQLPSAYIAFL
jgi:hypothetical protein